MKKLFAVLVVACFAAVGFAQELDGGKFPPSPGPNDDPFLGSVAPTLDGGELDGGKFPPSPGPNDDPVIGNCAAANGGGGGKHDGGKFPPTPGPNGRHNNAILADGGELDGGKFPPTPGPTGEGMFG